MDVLDDISTQGHMHKPPAEPVQVQLELLPPYKQLLLESRQHQTVADLLLERSKQQIHIARRRVGFLKLLRQRLRERPHPYQTFEQAQFWEDLSARGQLRGEGEQPSSTEQELWQMANFTDYFAYVRQLIASNRQALRDCLDALNDQVVLMRQLEDPIQQHQASEEVHEHYQHWLEELRETLELLREQRVTYRIIRLHYRAVHAQLRAEKAVID